MSEMPKSLLTMEDFIAWSNDATLRKKWPEAIRRWTLMREKYPERPRGYFSGAEALKENGNFKTADALILEGLEKFPEEPHLYIEYGKIAMRQKTWPEAIKRWALMREKCPERPFGYFSGAEALKENGNFKAADALILEGLEKFPEEPHLYIEYGKIAMRQKTWPEAIKRWALMREKCPERPFGYFSGAEALKESGDFKAADALILEGLEKFPEEPHLYIEYGKIAMRQKTWPEAIKRWRLMREKCPERPRGYFSGSEALKENGDFEAADALVLEGVEKFPQEANLYAEYGKIAMRQKNWPEAIKRWTLMRERCPERPRGYFSGAEALKENGNFKAADALILEGLEKFPREANLYAEYGQVAMYQKDWEEATRRWTLMRERCPNHLWGYLQGSVAFKNQVNFEYAESLILAGIKNFPKEPRLYVEYGDIAMCNENWTEAIRRWTLMREKFPQHPQGYVGGVAALKENEELENAETLLLEGLKKFPKAIGLYVEYGDIAMCRKDWLEAVKRWTLVRKKFPRHLQGYMSGIVALTKIGDFEKAEELALEGLKKFPKEIKIRRANKYIKEIQIAQRLKKNNGFESIKRNIMQCKDSLQYLKFLKEISNCDGISIIICIKNSEHYSQKNYEEKIFNLIYDIGFNIRAKESFSKLPYIGILENNCIICEMIGNRENDIVNFKKYKYEIMYRKYCNGNPCSIKINDKEYSINDNEINIIIYDLYDCTLIDSSSIDILKKETIIKNVWMCNLIKTAKLCRNFGVETYFFFAPAVYRVNNPSKWEKLLICGEASEFTKDNIHKNYYRLSGIDECFSSISDFYDHLKNLIRSIDIEYKNYQKNVYMVSKYSNIGIDGCRVVNNKPFNYERVVHIFGDSVGLCARLKDDDIVSYQLQKLFNDGNFKIKVINYCVAGLGIDKISNYIRDTNFSTGDIIIIFLSREKEKVLVNQIEREKLFYLSLQEIFNRPHDYGEVFIDCTHGNHNMHKIIAKLMYDNIYPHLKKISNKISNTNNANKIQYNQLDGWLNKIKCESKHIGAIVMNCNPFTNGHRYLIEYAAKYCIWLYIFVVEEDRSIFPFKDRFELVKQGTSDLKNVTVLSSGQFIISQLTFPEYSQKANMQNIEIDPSLDVEIFAEHIAPVLGINVRFAGSEPLDKITCQYNECMKQVLPKYGIEFREIPRRELDGNIISASRVRKLLDTDNFDEIKMLVPETTFNYLKSYKNNTA